MMYVLTRSIRENLKARRYPFHESVVFGPERLARSSIRNAIVVMHDTTGGDRFGSPNGFQRNARRAGVRFVGAVAYFYAQSGKSGAALHDHQEEAEVALDMFTTALNDVVSQMKQDYSLEGGRFLRPEETANLLLPEAFSGVVYELRFTVARAVLKVNYAGEGQPVFTIEDADDVSSTVQVAQQHGEPAPI